MVNEETKKNTEKKIDDRDGATAPLFLEKKTYHGSMNGKNEDSRSKNEWNCINDILF